MKKRNATRQQKGFFDLGFSPAILTLSGAFAYATTPDQDDRITVQEQQTDVVAGLATGNGSANLYEKSRFLSHPTYPSKSASMIPSALTFSARLSTFSVRTGISFPLETQF